MPAPLTAIMLLILPFVVANPGRNRPIVAICAIHTSSKRAGGARSTILVDVDRTAGADRFEAERRREADESTPLRDYEQEEAEPYAEEDDADGPPRSPSPRP